MTEPRCAFDCPACAQVIVVDASMRQALLKSGCVVCGSTVSGGAFS